MERVRAACLVYRPWVRDCVEEYPTNCSNPGVSALALHDLFESVGLNVEFTTVKSYLEAYDLMKNDKADLLCNPYYPVSKLMTQFGYTVPVAQVRP